MLNQQDYIKHPLNNSTAKTTFSFSKDKRFKQHQKSIDKTYDLPDTKSKRTCTFGFGNKMQLANKTFGPQPNRYNLNSDFEKTHVKGFSFGSGREQSIFGSLSPTKKQFPGPGTYALPVNNIQNNGYIGIKLNSLLFQKKNNTPGPGSYSVEQTQVKTSGRYRITGYKNLLSPKYIRRSVKSEIKFALKKMQLGPGQYESLDELSPQGRYISSKFRSSKVRSFSKSKRPEIGDLKKKDIPGPGNYKMFSEFGNINISNIQKAKIEIKLSK